MYAKRWFSARRLACASLFGIAACSTGNRSPSDAEPAQRSRQAVEAPAPSDPGASFFGPTAVAYVQGLDRGSSTSTAEFDEGADPSLLIVADTLNSTIRQLDSASGLATTLAGGKGIAGSADGVGSAARFNQPQGLCASGKLVFVSDTGNHTVRLLDPITHSVTTFAGQAGVPGTNDDSQSAAAHFNHPHGLAIALTGPKAVLYVADTDNSTIRRLDPVVGNTVTTAAGLAGTPGDNGLATVAGAAARFRRPTGLAACWSSALSRDVLYIADTGNHTIRALDTLTGEVSVLAGVPGSYGFATSPGPALFAKPTGLACTLDHALLVTDTASHTVQRIDLTTHAVTSIAGSPWEQGTTDAAGAAARFRAPAGISALQGTFAIADQGNDTIRLLSYGKGAVTTFSGTPRRPGTNDGYSAEVSLGTPTHVLCDGSKLYVDGAGINAIDIATGATEQVASVGLVAFMTRIGGALYTADGMSYVVRKLDLGTREYGVISGNGNASTSPQVFGLTSIGDTLYRALQTGDDAGEEDTVLTGSPVSDQPPQLTSGTWSAHVPGTQEIATDGQRVYFTQNGFMNDDTFSGSGATLGVVDLSTHAVSTLAGQHLNGYQDGPGSSALFSGLGGIAVSGSQIYVADTINQVIRKYDLQTGLVSTVAGGAGLRGFADGAGGAARFDTPNGLCVQGTDLYVADGGNGKLRKIDLTSGTVSTLALTRKGNRCGNGFQDGDETGVDCGGSCQPCADTVGCVSNSDCRSQRCVEGVCGASCTDGILNGGESDVDCGASCPYKPCAQGKRCSALADCASGSCVAGICGPVALWNGVKDGDETDVDCGGTNWPCDPGKHCATASDCSSRVCTAGICAAPSCTDGVRNGNEWASDCRGNCDNFCKVGQACRDWTDCESYDCEAHVCVATCTDGVKNGSESDLDCGGGKCATCATGLTCEGDLDCFFRVCSPISWPDPDLPFVFASPTSTVPKGVCR